MAAKGGAVRWSAEQLAAYRARTGGSGPTPAPAAPPARSKYRAEKVEHDGEKFDSRKEARRWAQLQEMERAGMISELQRQVAFVLAPAVLLAGEARKKPALRYIADAVYMQAGVLIIEDVKSAPTRKTSIYRAKKHLMATVHNIHIKEV